MKRKLIFILITTLAAWGIQAALNPHITDLNLGIYGVVDYDEFYEPSPSITPKGPGGFICSNGWKKITLKAVGVNDPMKTRLNWNSARIEVWTATNGGTQVLSPTLWDPASSMPTQLWVKGVSVSATGPTKDASGNWTNCGPEHITLEAINNGANPTTPGTYYDRVAFTVVSVTFQAGTGTNTQAITNVTTLVDKDAMIEAVVSPASLGGSITYSITDTAKATVTPPTGTTSPQPLTVHGVSTSSVPTTLNAMVAGSVCGSLPVTVDKEKWILSYCKGDATGTAGGGGAFKASSLALSSLSKGGGLSAAATSESFVDVVGGASIDVPVNTTYTFKYRVGGAWYLSLAGFSPTVTWSGAIKALESNSVSMATHAWVTAGTNTVTATRTWHAVWFITLSSVSESITVNAVAADHMEYKWGSMAWTAVAATNYVPAGTNVQFKAYPAVTGTTWPAGKPVWANAAPSASDASEASKTFASTGFADVTTECGNVVSAKMCALAMDIEQAVTNVHDQMTSAALSLTTASYDGGGGVTWTSSPAGLSVVGYTASTFTFNPSNSTPTSYVVTAWASALTNCMDSATVNVYRVELTPDATNVCWQSSNPVEIVLTNSYAPGGITWSGTNGLKVVSATDAKLVFTPTNSVATNYAVKAASTGSPNCFDTATVNVYRVELTPDATNVCWQTTNPVEIVLTNSYAPGGITWSGTNGLKVISATDVKLVFTPTNSTPTNYAVKAASAGFPNCYDVCTVNVYRVELTPKATNVCWQTTAPVEIVLTNSYAPGGITWSGTNGLKVVSATDAKLVFTPTNSTPTNYAVKAAATGFPICYDVCTVNVWKVDIVQTNLEAHVYCTNCTPFNLTADSWTNVTWSMSPDLGTNGAQFIAGTTWTGSGGTNTWHGTNVWVYSGPVSNKYTLTARAVELISCYDTATLEVLKPEFVDLNWLEATNEILHHTSLYQTNALVLRRSDKFKVDAKLSKGYTNTCFNVWFQAVQNFDGTPKTNDVPVVTADLGLTDWYCKLLSTSDNADQTTTAHMEINIPSTNCPIGEYQWRALVVPKAATNVVLDTTNFPGQVIILFNPWSSNDSVHMANDADRQEYVMRTSGIMWTGSRTRKTTKTWQYAQFDTDSIGVLLSELVGQNTSARMDPILVSRHFSARVNCNGGGILWGLWPTNNVWPGGTNASYWAGSVEIFNQYRSTGNPVKYGQCWVFGGLLTSMLRSSGIPSRPLTTYNSGHDANANKIIEHYYRTDGSYDKIRSEGIWNFHVWCEAWMTRPDRPGHDGWQAVDATPQEISAGAYQCGPASHVAVQGNLGGNYDVDFVYAEVSADFQRWEDTPGGGMVLVNTLVDRVGHDISTKSVGADTLHDITAEYK